MTRCKGIVESDTFGDRRVRVLHSACLQEVTNLRASKSVCRVAKRGCESFQLALSEGRNDHALSDCGFGPICWNVAPVPVLFQACVCEAHRHRTRSEGCAFTRPTPSRS